MQGTAIVSQSGKEIFVSYSHRDQDWLERLQVHLKPLFREGEISVWADTKLQPGSSWYEEIDQALARASAAVLLLSPDFLASEFIMKTEWPKLKLAALERGLKILPVAVRSSAVLDTEIAQYQGLIDLAKPLDQYGPAEQGARMVALARKVRDLAASGPADVGPAAPARTSSALRVFDTGMLGINHCVSDDESNVWVSNGQQVKVFRLDQEQPVQRWLLPDRPRCRQS